MRTTLSATRHVLAGFQSPGQFTSHTNAHTHTARDNCNKLRQQQQQKENAGTDTLACAPFPNNVINFHDEPDR